MKTTLIKQQDIISSLINEAVSSTLSECLFYFPDMHGNILTNLRWGFFLTDSAKKSLFTCNPQKTSTSTFPCFVDLNEEKTFIGQLNFAQIFKAENYIQEILAEDSIATHTVFDSKTYHIACEKLAQIFINFTDYTSCIESNQLENKLISSSELDSFFQAFEPRLMLPPASIALGFTDYDNLCDSQCDCADIYQKWQWEIQKKLSIDSHSTYMQIGGYSNCIQSDPDNYIGQINNDIGDGGSVVVYIDNNTMAIKGYIDMG